MAGKTLKFGGSGLVEGQHTWYETVLPDADGHLDIEGDRLVRGTVKVERAEPGHEVEADKVVTVNSMPNGQRLIRKTADEYVARQQASLVTGAATATSGPAKGAPAKS